MIEFVIRTSIFMTFLQSKNFISFVKKPPEHYILTKNHFSDYRRMQLLAHAIIGLSERRRRFLNPRNLPSIGHCLYYNILA